MSIFGFDIVEILFPARNIIDHNAKILCQIRQELGSKSSPKTSKGDKERKEPDISLGLIDLN
ncbi:MAG TPA: hypothetical protein VGJ92_12645 [Methanocella sp.]|jgi:hypothetical protein